MTAYERRGKRATVESMQAARREARAGHWEVEIHRVGRRYELSEHLIDGPRDPFGYQSSTWTMRGAERRARRWLKRRARAQAAEAARNAVPLRVVR